MRKSFGMDHNTITELAEKEAPGCEGVNFLPYLTGTPCCEMSCPKVSCCVMLCPAARQGGEGSKGGKCWSCLAGIPCPALLLLQALEIIYLVLA